MIKIKKVQQDNSPNICVHCNREITIAKVIGISVVCPFCGKPSDKILNQIKTLFINQQTFININ